jgi:hypothetical protein
LRKSELLFGINRPGAALNSADPAEQFGTCYGSIQLSNAIAAGQQVQFAGLNEYFANPVNYQTIFAAKDHDLAELDVFSAAGTDHQDVAWSYGGSHAASRDSQSESSRVTDYLGCQRATDCVLSFPVALHVGA